MRAAPAARPRLVLFDIDGTLLSGGRAARSVFAGALTEVFGTCGDVETFALEGKIDPMIVKELLLAAGIPEETVLRRRGDALALYLDRLEAALARERPILKPGVAAVLDGVARDGAAVSALLTGNVERGARIKLSAVDLWDRFAFGAFVDEAAGREDLGPIALTKARRLGHTFTGSDCVVVGDARRRGVRPRARRAHLVASRRKRHRPIPSRRPAPLVADLSNTSRRWRPSLADVPSRPLVLALSVLAAAGLSGMRPARASDTFPGPPFDLDAKTPHDVVFTIDTKPARDVLGLLSGAPEPTAALRRLKASAHAALAIRGQNLSPDDYYGKLVSAIAGTPDPLFTSFAGRGPYFAALLDEMDASGAAAAALEARASPRLPTGTPVKAHIVLVPFFAISGFAEIVAVNGDGEVAPAADLPRLVGDVATAPPPREILLKVLRGASAEAWRALFDANVRKAPAWPPDNDKTLDFDTLLAHSPGARHASSYPGVLSLARSSKTHRPTT